ncbi:MAG TPA: cytochrome P450 [Solirubrobacteraceae bacterium]|nr:cytochrome P450 [Solirubrobacteraceae bacterium]
MLPPGPATPAAAQTIEWIARPTHLLRRSAARYGEPFTLRTLWADAPMVLVSDPATVKRVYAAPEASLRGGASSTVLEPFAGPSSILLTSGEAHLRQRRLMLPPFHGERLEAHRATVAALARAELDRWEPGRPLRTLPRMQELTLDVILRVVLGAPAPQLRAAIRDALDMTTSLPRLIALSLAPRGSAPWRPFERAVGRVDALLRATIRARRAVSGERAPGDDHPRPAAQDPAAGGRAAPPVTDEPIAAGGRAAKPILDDLIAAGSTEDELRDQVVTLLAAGHETTAGSLAWALERLARHPRVAARLRDGDDAYLDATVKEVLRLRPVLSITPRKVVEPFPVGEWTLPPGVHVTPCLYLAHRRPELWPEPTAFRPERFLEGAPSPYSWLPFGGGVRRCAGAAFATMELHEVLRAVVRRFELAPDRPEGERMRRRGVTLAPSRGGRVVPLA